MPDYSKTIIYKICCNDTNIKDIYIGSTCNFTQRKWLHKTHCNNKLNRNNYNTNNKLYKIMRENGGWDNWSMIELERYTECRDKREKEKYERDWYDKLKPTLNGQLPSRTKEEEKEYFKNRYRNNKEKILEKDKIRYQKNKEKIKEQKKEYYEKNKEKINEKRKLKYQKNKDKISKKGKERVNCPKCNKELSRASLSRHMKSTNCKK